MLCHPSEATTYFDDVQRLGITAICYERQIGNNKMLKTVAAGGIEVSLGLAALDRVDKIHGVFARSGVPVAAHLVQNSTSSGATRARTSALFPVHVTHQHCAN